MGADLPAIAEATVLHNGLPQSHRGQCPQGKADQSPIRHRGTLCHIPLNHTDRSPKQQACMCSRHQTMGCLTISDPGLISVCIYDTVSILRGVSTCSSMIDVQACYATISAFDACFPPISIPTSSVYSPLKIYGASGAADLECAGLRIEW